MGHRLVGEVGRSSSESFSLEELSFFFDFFRDAVASLEGSCRRRF